MAVAEMGRAVDEALEVAALDLLLEFADLDHRAEQRDAVRDQLPPINTHSDEFEHVKGLGRGFGHVYVKTAVMLYNLQYVLGDSLFLAAMQHYFDQVIETAGLYNTAGFNDDTRAYPSIPARHDMWRRAAVNWLADLVVRGMLDEDDAVEMAAELAYGLAKRTYKL